MGFEKLSREKNDKKSEASIKKMKCEEEEKKMDAEFMSSEERTLTKRY